MTSGESVEDEPAERQTIVFVHGSGDSAKAWEHVLPLLGEYPTLALDLPGRGANMGHAGPREMSVRDYAENVRAELAQRDLSGICLVGHSLGSAIALRLAVDHPSLVGRLVLVGAGTRLRVLPALLQEAQEHPAQAMEQLVGLGFAPGHEAAAEGYFSALVPVAEGMLLRDLTACNAFEMMDELGRVAQPALVLVGAEDRLTPPKYAAFLREHLAHATLVEVPAAGHYLNAEAPETLAEALRGWLEAQG